MPKLRWRHGQRTGAEQRIFSAHQRPADQRVIGLVQGLDAGDLVDHPLLQMILKIAADAGAFQGDRNAQGLQPFRIADAGALQNLDRADRTRRTISLRVWRGASNDLAALLEAHARGASPF